jgi:hypothetical protein
MIITDECVLYSKGRKAPDNHVRETLFFDHEFLILYGQKDTKLDKSLILRH